MPWPPAQPPGGSTVPRGTEQAARRTARTSARLTARPRLKRPSHQESDTEPARPDQNPGVRFPRLPPNPPSPLRVPSVLPPGAAGRREAAKPRGTTRGGPAATAPGTRPSRPLPGSTKARAPGAGSGAGARPEGSTAANPPRAEPSRTAPLSAHAGTFLLGIALGRAARAPVTWQASPRGVATKKPPARPHRLPFQLWRQQSRRSSLGCPVTSREGAVPTEESVAHARFSAQAWRALWCCRASGGASPCEVVTLSRESRAAFRLLGLWVGAGEILRVVFDLHAGLSHSDLTGMMDAVLTARGNKQLVI